MRRNANTANLKISTAWAMNRMGEMTFRWRATHFLGLEVVLVTNILTVVVMEAGLAPGCSSPCRWRRGWTWAWQGPTSRSPQAEVTDWERMTRAGMVGGETPIGWGSWRRRWEDCRFEEERGGGEETGRWRWMRPRPPSWPFSAVPAAELGCS
jgi:hypothetical protein